MDYVRIGLIAKPQGIRGEIKVNSLSDRLDRFLELEDVFVENKGVFTPFRVKGARLGNDCAFLFLEKIYTRDEAETLRGKYLCVDRAHAIKLPEGRYFIFDLIGCVVQTDGGQTLGTVTDVLQPGANDVYVISDGQKERLIPVVDEFVLSVDVDRKTIVVAGDRLGEVVVDED